MRVERIMSTRTALALSLLAFASLALPSSAFAQGTQSAPASDDYKYVFPDDPLDAGLFGPNDVHIRVVPKPKRSVLIRPRTQFIVEMLKSVETL